MALGLGVSLSLLGAGCALEEGGPELGSETAELGFDWGGDCESGSGVFQAHIPVSQVVEIGQVPANKKDLVISLRSSADVDVRLVDQATGFEIIAWPDGLMHGPDRACAEYEGVEYCYSGYNGYDSDNDGVRERGSEKIEVFGVTNRTLVMKAYGFRSGDAQVDYAWSPANTCKEKGSGEFAQKIPYFETVVVGEIPTDKVNVFIQLATQHGRDVDVQLIDAADGTEIIAWPNGLMHGAGEESIDYRGMLITYSGYNGRDQNWGLEDIRIDGVVTRPLIMRAFGYQSDAADISYTWGGGAGAICGGRNLPPCGPGLMCKNGDDGEIEADRPGQCHTEPWCESQSSAKGDCANVPHIMVPGQWTCPEFRCRWKPDYSGAGLGDMCGGITGIACRPGLMCKGVEPNVADAAGSCQVEDYCEIKTAESDCSSLVHSQDEGGWGCEENTCRWVSQADVDLVSFDELRAQPVGYADGRLIQVSWSVDAQTGGLVNEVLGEAPTTSPPLGAGGDFVILGGVQCNGTDCDYDRGSWVTVTGRLGLLQGGHLLMQVLRTRYADTCSSVDQSCPDEMHCQIGIGCPTPNNCGINPPGVCLED